jgi:hypothetical protein
MVEKNDIIKIYNKKEECITFFFNRAGDGNRTHVISLEGWSSTIELHPHTMPRAGIEPATRGFSVLCSTD